MRCRVAAAVKDVAVVCEHDHARARRKLIDQPVALATVRTAEDGGNCADAAHCVNAAARGSVVALPPHLAFCLFEASHGASCNRVCCSWEGPPFEANPSRVVLTILDKQRQGPEDSLSSWNQGIGWVDVNLLVSCLDGGVLLWTNDRELRANARLHGRAFPTDGGA